jgi:hypothetical protein
MVGTNLGSLGVETKVEGKTLFDMYGLNYLGSLDLETKIEVKIIEKQP